MGMLSTLFKTTPRDNHIHVDAEAAAILSSATAAVRVILDRRAALDKAGLQDTPLVVLAGERHSNTAHTLHHLALISALHKAEKIAVGYEWPHNLVTQRLNLYGDGPASAEAVELIKDMDSQGTLSLKSCIALTKTEYSHLSSSALYRFMLRENIPFRTTDTARNDDSIDKNDPSAAASIKECFDSHPSKISLLTARGVKIRNHHMARMGLDFARASGARILIQHSGSIHVLGDGEKIRFRLSNLFRLKSPFYKNPFKMEDSLAGQYRAINIPFVAAPLSMDILSDKFMAKNNLKPDDVIPLHDLPAQSFSYSMKSDDPKPKSPLFLRGIQKYFDDNNDETLQEESTYFNRIAEGIGLPNEKISVQEMTEMQNDLTIEMLIHFRAVRKIAP